MDGRQGQWEIYGATLAGSSVPSMVRVTTDSNQDEVPQIYGDWVVWQRGTNPARDVIGVFGKNFVTGQEFTIPGGGAPAIFGNTVAYVGASPENGISEIYAYDILTQTSRRITNDSSYQSWCDVYGDTVVWMDQRSGNWDIFSYNLTTGQESQLTDNGFDQWKPAIYKNTVLWYDARDPGSIYDVRGSIYGTEITPVPVPSALMLLGSGIVALAGCRRKLFR